MVGPTEQPSGSGGGGGCSDGATAAAAAPPAVPARSAFRPPVLKRPAPAPPGATVVTAAAAAGCPAAAQAWAAPAAVAPPPKAARLAGALLRTSSPAGRMLAGSPSAPALLPRPAASLLRRPGPAREPRPEAAAGPADVEASADGAAHHRDAPNGVRGPAEGGPRASELRHVKRLPVPLLGRVRSALEHAPPAIQVDIGLLLKQQAPREGGPAHANLPRVPTAAAAAAFAERLRPAAESAARGPLWDAARVCEAALLQATWESDSAVATVAARPERPLGGPHTADAPLDLAAAGAQAAAPALAAPPAAKLLAGFLGTQTAAEMRALYDLCCVAF